MLLLPDKIIEIRNIKIQNKLAKNNIKIVSVSDIHISVKTKIEDILFLINTIKSQKPNYICILGDSIDSPELLKNKRERNILLFLYKELSNITKVFIVLGNHDYIHYYKENKYLQDYNEYFYNYISNMNNIYLLKDKTYLDDYIYFMGYWDKYNIYHDRNMHSFEDDIKKRTELYKNVLKDRPSVMLIHSPEPLRYKYNNKFIKDYNIILAGHYHNGCLPFFLEHTWLPENGGIVTPSKEIFPNDVRGEEKINNSIILFNGGYTKIANNTPTYLHFLDRLCYRQIDSINITNENINSDIEVNYKKILRK